MGIFNSAIFNNKVFNTGATAIGGGANKFHNSYEISKHEWETKERLNRDRLKNAQELAAKQARIEMIEEKRLRDLEDEQLQKDLLRELRLLQVLQEERVRLEKLLQFYVQDDDDVILLLACVI